MAEGAVAFGHDGFTERFAAIAKVIPASAGAEKIAYAPGVGLAVQAWMNSAEHKEQIFGNYDYTGVGVAWDASRPSTIYPDLHPIALSRSAGSKRHAADRLGGKRSSDPPSSGLRADHSSVEPPLAITPDADFEAKG
jgi:hypothetical protein